MALAESIFAKLSADPKVLAALGQTAGEAVRIFPGMGKTLAPAPYVVWQEISSTPDATHGEASASGIRMVQFSIVTQTYLAARNLAAAIIAALDSVPLAAGEICLSCAEHDGFSDDTEQFLRIVEATFFAAPAVPA